MRMPNRCLSARWQYARKRWVPIIPMSECRSTIWLFCMRAQSRYADALPIVQKTISQNSANKSVAFGVLYGSQSQNLISPTQALNASYTVLQHSASSAAGEASIKTCSSLCGWH